MVEFRYEICAPEKKTTRCKCIEKSSYSRLEGNIIYKVHVICYMSLTYHLHINIMPHCSNWTMSMPGTYYINIHSFIVL